MGGWSLPFWNAEERRLRAGWRLLLVAVLFVLASLATALVTVVAAPLLGVQARPASPTAPWLAITRPIQLAATLLTLGFLALVADRRRLRDYGLRFGRTWWLDLGFGLALGAALQTGIFLVEYAVGWVRVVGVAVTADPGASFAVWVVAAAVGYLAVGVYEELFARGYLLTNVAEGLDGLGPIDARGAVAGGTLLSALVFGGLHAVNPAATAVSTATLVLAGVFLAVGYVLTDELAIPIGLHISWNFFQGVVWGFPVSGVSVGVSVVAVEQSGPTVVTGGQFGPEAGLIGVAAMLLGMVGIGAWVRYRGGDLRIHPGITTPELRWRR